MNMNSPKEYNPYAILEVHAAMTDVEIRAAWQRVARATHPDRPGGDTDAFARASRAFADVATKAQRERLARRWSLTAPKCQRCSGSGAEREGRGFTGVVLSTCGGCQGAGYL